MTNPTPPPSPKSQLRELRKRAVHQMNTAEHEARVSRPDRAGYSRDFWRGIETECRHEIEEIDKLLDAATPEAPAAVVLASLRARFDAIRKKGTEELYGEDPFFFDEVAQAFDDAALASAPDGGRGEAASMAGFNFDQMLATKPRLSDDSDLAHLARRHNILVEAVRALAKRDATAGLGGA